METRYGHIGICATIINLIIRVYIEIEKYTGTADLQYPKTLFYIMSII